MARDQRAGRGHADEDRAGPGADRGARLLAERGVRLVADHDRVGARDAAGVAHEPLVGLDRDRAVGAVLVAEQRRRDALLVAAVAQLAEELVDEVAPVGQDQHAAGARGLDEAERGDRLAGAGRVLEPEALGGVGVLGLLGELLLVLGDPSRAPPRPSRRAAPRPRRGRARPRARRRRPRSSSSSSSSSAAGAVELLLVVVVLVLEPRRSSSSVLRRTRAPRRGSPSPRAAAPRPRRRGSPRGQQEHVDAARAVAARRPDRCASASSAVSVPERASTWWAESIVPSASFGSSSESTRSRPSSSENSRRHAVEGAFSAAVELGERLVERAPPRRARRERDRELLARVHEGLARERLRARDVGVAGKGRSGH